MLPPQGSHPSEEAAVNLPGNPQNTPASKDLYAEAIDADSPGAQDT